MKLWLAAVGLRPPGWAEDAFADFAKRFPPEMRLELKAVKAEPRSGKTAEQLMQALAEQWKAVGINASLDSLKQEALIILFRKIGTLRATGALASWMFQIVRHEWLQRFQRLHQDLLLEFLEPVLGVGGMPVPVASE